MFEKKFKFVFMRKEYSTLNFVGMIKTNNLSNVVKFHNKTFVISIDKPAYSEPKTKVYLLDFDSGSQLNFAEIKSLLTPEELDLYLSSDLIKKLTEGAIADRKEKIINMILGAIIGALFSALLMFFYMQNKIDEIYKSVTINPISIGG